jgi:hypothetical protein
VARVAVPAATISFPGALTGEFVTHGVGVPLLTMRNPEAASGRAAV